MAVDFALKNYNLVMVKKRSVERTYFFQVCLTPLPLLLPGLV